MDIKFNNKKRNKLTEHNRLDTSLFEQCTSNTNKNILRSSIPKLNLAVLPNHHA